MTTVENYLYAYSGIVPIIQTIVGGAAFVRNIAGLINDLGRCIFNGMGWESYNQKIELKISKLDLTISSIVALQNKLRFLNATDLTDTSGANEDEVCLEKLKKIEQQIKDAYGDIHLWDHQQNEINAENSPKKTLFSNRESIV